MSHNDDKSLLEQLDEIAPIKKFDAFPKLPSSYKSRTKFGGLMTVLVISLSLILVLNDVAEFVWGWSDYEFAVDREQYRLLNINVDLVVNTPCGSLSIDLRDAVGDRLHLSDMFRRDGTLFDVGQAHEFKEHQRKLSTREIVAASRKSRGFFSLFSSPKPQFRPTWNHTPDGGACRVYGSVSVKKLTGNFHITTLGHGYGGHRVGHTEHNQINMSHVISEFSFGPYYPEITQPLDYSYELTEQSFVSFQYFITVVPTTYIAPRSRPLHTHQYSVTHYVKPIDHGRGTPGIFFKYDIDPVALEIHQRTTSWTQFLVRIVGVIGGVWVCFGWGIKVASKVSQKAGITSDDDEPIAEVSGLSSKKRWRGSELGGLRRRGGDDAGSGWSSPMGSGYGSYSNQGTPASPYASFSAQGAPPSPYYGSTHLGPPSARSSQAGFPTSPGRATTHLAPSSPYSPSNFPPSPLPGQASFPSAGLAPHSPRPGSAGNSPYAPPSPLPPTPGSANMGVFASQQRPNSRPSSIIGVPPPPQANAVRKDKKED